MFHQSAFTRHSLPIGTGLDRCGAKLKIQLWRQGRGASPGYQVLLGKGDQGNLSEEAAR